MTETTKTINDHITVKELYSTAMNLCKSEKYSIKPENVLIGFTYKSYEEIYDNGINIAELFDEYVIPQFITPKNIGIDDDPKSLYLLRYDEYMHKENIIKHGYQNLTYLKCMIEDDPSILDKNVVIGELDVPNRELHLIELTYENSIISIVQDVSKMNKIPFVILLITMIK